jgi:hypothetical protein
VRVLSRLFRRLFLQSLRDAFDAGKLRFFGDFAGLVEPTVFGARLHELRRINWVVYPKPAFGGPKQVLAYLGRYTHRVAVASRRLIALTNGKVSFTWKDYRHHSKTKAMTLGADEFIRQVILQSLPDGFHRIRCDGFLANGGRSDKIAHCRHMVATRSADAGPATAHGNSDQQFNACNFPICPECGGTMRRTAVAPRSANDQPSAATCNRSSRSWRRKERPPHPALRLEVLPTRFARTDNATPKWQKVQRQWSTSSPDRRHEFPAGPFPPMANSRINQHCFFQPSCAYSKASQVRKLLCILMGHPTVRCARPTDSVRDCNMIGR